MTVTATPSWAQSPTVSSVTPTVAASPTSKTVSEKLNDQINQLKEKIASRVSELNLVEKRGVLGTIADSGANQITLTDISGKTRFIDVDEITKFSSPTAKGGSFGLSDLTKGTRVRVLGLYNKQSKRILGRFIDVTTDPTFLSGAVSEIDRPNGRFTLVSEDQKKTVIDVQTITKISSYSKADGLTQAGFSKMETGDRVTVMGFPDKQNLKMIVASRINTFPGLPKNPKIVIHEPEPTPASGSGKKVVPITRTPTSQ